MAYNNTGLFRVSRIKNGNLKKGFRYSYQIHNDLVDMDIRRTDIMDLKRVVLERGLLWGITDLEKAKQTAIENETNIYALTGRYGYLGREPNGIEQQDNFQNELDLKMKNNFKNENQK